MGKRIKQVEWEWEAGEGQVSVFNRVVWAASLRREQCLREPRVSAKQKAAWGKSFPGRERSLSQSPKVQDKEARGARVQAGREQ